MLSECLLKSLRAVSHTVRLSSSGYRLHSTSRNADSEMSRFPASADDTVVPVDSAEEVAEEKLDRANTGSSFYGPEAHDPLFVSSIDVNEPKRVVVLLLYVIYLCAVTIFLKASQRLHQCITMATMYSSSGPFRAPDH